MSDDDVCPDCEGRGEVLDAPGRVLDGAPYWTQCDTCHGRKTLFAAWETERAAREQAERERDEALKDARRYRWLRGRNPVSLATIAWGASKAACKFGEPDEAIDAALREM